MSLRAPPRVQLNTQPRSASTPAAAQPQATSRRPLSTTTTTTTAAANNVNAQPPPVRGSAFQRAKHRLKVLLGYAGPRRAQRDRQEIVRLVSILAYSFVQVRTAGRGIAYAEPWSERREPAVDRHHLNPYHHRSKDNESVPQQWPECPPCASESESVSVRALDMLVARRVEPPLARKARHLGVPRDLGAPVRASSVSATVCLFVCRDLSIAHTQRCRRAARRLNRRQQRASRAELPPIEFPQAAQQPGPNGANALPEEGEAVVVERHEICPLTWTSFHLLCVRVPSCTLY